MALTTLDPQTALIVVDLQKGILASPSVHPIGKVVTRARLLADAFRQRCLPVVLVNVFPRLGETGTAQDIVSLLGKRSA